MINSQFIDSFISSSFRLIQRVFLKRVRVHLKVHQSFLQSVLEILIISGEKIV
jgi:hypothetical protein